MTAGLAGAAGVGVVRNFLNIAGAAEQSNIAFNTIIKDMDRTKALIADLNKFSVKTPFEPTEVRKAGQALLAFGNTVEQVPDFLKLLGDISAGTGANLGELTLVFNKIKSAGKLTGETFLQLAERGANVRTVLAEMLGKSTAEIEKMQTKGQISFEMVVQAMRKMTGQGGIFFGAMEKQSESLNGKLSTLVGGFNDVKRQIGEALLPVAKQVTAVFIRVVDAFTAANKASGGLLAKVAGFVVVIGTVVAAVSSLVLAASTLGITMSGVIAALTTGASIAAPFIAAAIAIGGVVAGVMQVFKWLSKIPAVSQAWRNTIDKITIAWENLKEVFGTVRDLIVRTFDKLVASLNRTFGTTIKSLEGGFIGMITRMINAVGDFVAGMTEMILAFARNWNATWFDMGRVVEKVLKFRFAEAVDITKGAVDRIKATKKELELERKKRLEALKRRREEAEAATEEAKKAKPDIKAKVKIEFPRGTFGIEDLQKQFQDRELKREKTEKKIEGHTKRAADGIGELVKLGSRTEDFGTARD